MAHMVKSDIHVGNFNMKLTGRWFPQIVDYKGQWESISNIYITKIVVLVSEPVRGRSRATELPCCPYCVQIWIKNGIGVDKTKLEQIITLPNITFGQLFM